MYERNTSFVSIISAFAVGGLLGAGIALLMAPQSGQETRDRIRNKSLEIKDKAIETAEDTRERATRAISDVTQQTKEKVSSLSKRGQQMVEDQKRQLNEKMRTM
jgi:gas vesicle protein